MRLDYDGVQIRVINRTVETVHVIWDRCRLGDGTGRPHRLSKDEEPTPVAPGGVDLLVDWWRMLPSYRRLREQTAAATSVQVHLVLANAANEELCFDVTLEATWDDRYRLYRAPRQWSSSSRLAACACASH
jgi:hypothetical protein